MVIPIFSSIWNTINNIKLRNMNFTWLRSFENSHFAMFEQYIWAKIQKYHIFSILFTCFVIYVKWSLLFCANSFRMYPCKVDWNCKVVKWKTEMKFRLLWAICECVCVCVHNTSMRSQFQLEKAFVGSMWSNESFSLTIFDGKGSDSGWLKSERCKYQSIDLKWNEMRMNWSFWCYASPEASNLNGAKKNR